MIVNEDWNIFKQFKNNMLLPFNNSDYMPSIPLMEILKTKWAHFFLVLRFSELLKVWKNWNYLHSLFLVTIFGKRCGSRSCLVLSLLNCVLEEEMYTIPKIIRPLCTDWTNSNGAKLEASHVSLLKHEIYIYTAKYKGKRIGLVRKYLGNWC